VVVAEQHRRVAGKFKIVVSCKHGHLLLRREPGGGLCRRGGGGNGEGIGFGERNGVVVVVGVGDYELCGVHTASLHLLPCGTPF